MRQIFSVAFTTIALMVCEVEANNDEEARILAQGIAEESSGQRLALKADLPHCQRVAIQMHLTDRPPDITAVSFDFPIYRLK
jgi:hypothetical protein